MADSHERVGVRARVRFAQIPEWIIMDPNISNGAMRLYALLARYANTDDEAWPKRKTLAERMPGRTLGETGVSLTSIDKWLAELVTAGALTRELRFRDNGMQTSTSYTVEVIPLAPDPAASPVSGEGASPVSGEGASPVSGEGKNESQLNESQWKNDTPRTADADLPPAADAAGPTQPTIDEDADEDAPGCVRCGRSRADGHNHAEAPQHVQDVPAPGHDAPGASKPKQAAWKGVADARPDILELLEYLAESVQQCTGERPKASKNAFDTMRRLVDIDGRSPEKVRAAIDWARADQFWSGVILGAASLRKNYAKMQAQAVRARDGGASMRPMDRRKAILTSEMERLEREAAQGAATSEGPAIEASPMDLLRQVTAG
jgi:hypothetical protein